MSPQEVLDSLADIELTEEETTAALIKAKQDKSKRLEEIKRQERAAENRRKLTSSRWDDATTRGFMLYRAGQMFDGKMVIDDVNRAVFELLVYYFSEDDRFISQATALKVQKPSLEKGIMLLGNFGGGKTWLMKLFQKNQRQVYHMQDAKDIADEFAANGMQGQVYEDKFRNPVNDVDSFYHAFSGLCVDDIGTEDIKLHFGNRKNVIGDLIEKRYSRQNVGIFLHATSNLTRQQMTDFYGGRVLSRMYEIFNFIELPGEDRRK